MSVTIQVTPVDVSSPVSVLYCGVCSVPYEFCEFGTCNDKCKEWLAENYPDLALAQEASASLNISDEKPRGAGTAAPKKSVIKETKIIINRVQRQKRKYVTSVLGLDNVPDVKIKDIAKFFGKKFSSGASINDTHQGKEIVIQGDVSYDLPGILIQEYKVIFNLYLYYTIFILISHLILSFILFSFLIRLIQMLSFSWKIKFLDHMLK